MTDWTQVWTQIAVTPIITVTATVIAAAILVRRQGTATKRIKKREDVEGVLLNLEKEMRIFIHKAQGVEFSTVGEIYFVNFTQCSEILEYADYLGWWEKRFYATFCKRVYGRHITKQGRTFPRGMDEGDSLSDMVDYAYLGPENRPVAMNAKESNLLRPIFQGNPWLHTIKEEDPYVKRDAQGRGLLSAYRLALLPEALVWGEDYFIRLELANRILRCSRYARHPGIFWPLKHRFYVPRYLKLWLPVSEALTKGRSASSLFFKGKWARIKGRISLSHSNDKVNESDPGGATASPPSEDG